jgi:hypothetical protein
MNQRVILTIVGFVACSYACGETIYSDSLASNWQNMSWSSVVNFSNASPSVSGTSIAVTSSASGALMLDRTQQMSGEAFTTLVFKINPGPTGGQKLSLKAVRSQDVTNQTYPLPAYSLGNLTANHWTAFAVPLSTLGVASATDFSGFLIQNTSTTAAPTYYLDNVSLTPVATLPIPNYNLIYDDTYHNGFGQWGWNETVNNAATSPVHSGADSIAVTINQGWGAVAFSNGLTGATTDLNGPDYAAFQFWINGGSSGGQKLQMQATLTTSSGTNGLPAVQIGPLAANTWVEETVPLSSLGVANASQISGFWLQGVTGAAGPPFYLDDIALTPAKNATPLHLRVRANNPLEHVDSRMFGLNTATWNNALADQAVISYVYNAGLDYFRFPGGSTSDDYHWQTNSYDGNPGSSAWLTPFGAFATALYQLKGQAIITTNYGSGTPAEAASWVKDANVTIGLGIKDWEIGNECYGSWEYDTHARPHDPYTYAVQAAASITQMKAVDPTIRVAVVITASEDDYSNYTDHVATNPRTGLKHTGWSAVMLSTLASLKAKPDVVVYHYYAQNPGGESDVYLLNSSDNWKPAIAAIRQMLSDYYGTAAASIQIEVTENNSASYNPGKQMTSVVNALYYADSIGALLKTEARGFVWWDLKNGEGYSENNSNDLYGWREYGDYGILSSSDERYPTYYAMQTVSNFARGGDLVLDAACNRPTAMSVYSAKHPGGSVSIMVVNKQPSAQSAELFLEGFNPAAVATVYTYGLAQDEAERLGVGSPGMQTTSLSSASADMIYKYPAYSITVFTFQPSAASASIP